MDKYTCRVFTNETLISCDIAENILSNKYDLSMAYSYSEKMWTC